MRKLLVGMAVLVVLVIAAALAIPFVVPVDAYQGRLIALVRQVTGRDFRVAGRVKLALLPELTVEANDVSFANVPGARTPAMVQLRRVRVQLRLWPLLHGAVVVNRVVLLRPVIALEVDKAGRANWMSGPAAAPAALPARGTGWDISSLTVRKVRLIDGRVSYLDQRSGRAERLDNVNITLSSPSLKSRLAAGGSMVWRGEKVSFTLDIARPRSLLDGTESPIDSRLAAPSLSLSFSGRVAGLPSARLAGAIDLETKSARQLALWVGSPIAPSGGLGALAIRGRVQVAGNRVSLTAADLTLGASKAEGALSIDTSGTRPFVTGNLAIDRLDLDPYLSPQPAPTRQPAAPHSRPASPPPAPSVRGDTPPPTSPAPQFPAQPGGSGWGGGALTFADADLSLEVGNIAYQRFQIGAAALGLHIKDGRLNADLRRMALFGGNGHGQATIDGRGAVPSSALDVALDRIAFEPLAQAAVDNNRLTGTANLDIAVTARGQNERDFIATLSGSASLSLVNGQIKGVNLLALAESAAKIERDLIGTLDVAGAVNRLAHGQIKGINPLALAEDAARSLVGGSNTTNFARLTATCTITNGVVHNNELQVTAGSVPITGAGVVDLRTHAIGYRLSLQLPGNIMVPIEVGGTWDNPTYRADLALMLAQTPASALAILKSTGGSVGRNLKGVGQDLKGIGQGAVGVLKGLFGK